MVAASTHPATPAETASADTQADAQADIVAMSDLRRGARGRIARVLGDSSESARLKALGLCEGRSIEVLRTGDAWIVRVLGSRIGLSSQLVGSVLVAAA